MSEIFTRFSFDAVKFNGQIFAFLIVIWLVVLGCTISGILSQSFSRRHQAFWIVLVIALPLVGVLAYLPFSFKKDNLPHIFQTRNSKGKGRHGHSHRS